MSGWVIAVISIIMPGRSARDPDVTAVIQLLYGAEPVEGSLITLRPGERAAIRTQGIWTIQSPVDIGADGTVPARAALTLFS
jgi:hypothetical protein